ncbi:hypothetical protein M2139_001313 [Enterococcus sp. PF1-24]|uniref:hypothetical protein n=1 Tax=unclassified Enterococcus TaxID=2608891 RepID=UPI002473C336|nr:MULTISPECIES: hypothetical protein [unclassified Enterococcus]MDH6364382.1 hypothetical protein [Enterococcus sp. PFB1-1]MDH6401429.1 hypothetical protein [Enterococcus sp. PF1-24]
MACSNKKDTTSSSSTSEATATSSTQTTSSSTSSTTVETSTSETVENVPQRMYSKEEKIQINNEFVTWAGKQGEKGGLAVNSEYFNHGAAGFGDWYAVTDDGLIQVQQPMDPGRPGADGVPIHCLGGVVFYHSVKLMKLAKHLILMF